MYIVIFIIFVVIFSNTIFLIKIVKITIHFFQNSEVFLVLFLEFLMC